jgi:hypothetical protein
VKVQLLDLSMNPVTLEIGIFGLPITRVRLHKRQTEVHVTAQSKGGAEGEQTREQVRESVSTHM